MKKQSFNGIWIHFKILNIILCKEIEPFFFNVQLKFINYFPWNSKWTNINFTPFRTQIRNRFLRWIVSNQQNKVCKENRQTRPVPSEKGLALKNRKFIGWKVLLKEITVVVNFIHFNLFFSLIFNLGFCSIILFLRI